MFKSVIERQRAGRLGSGVWVSIGVHAALFVAVLFLASAPREQSRNEPPVIDFPDTWPSNGSTGVQAPAPRKQATQLPSRPKKERAPRQAQPLPVEPAVAPEPDDASSTDEVADEDAPDTSDSTASIGLPIGVSISGSGVIGCRALALDDTPTDEQLEFSGHTMTPPVLLMRGQPITYPPQAIAARVEGTLVAKCTITEQGRVRDCQIIKGLPHMDASVLEPLYSRRYSPVTFQGRPLSVRYTFTMRFSLPR